MTTDTRPKLASVELEIGDERIHLTGIAKGAGMIRPDMATMLAFVATDAAVDRIELQACLQRAVDLSFNRLTIDGDTSTNDACVLVATGASGIHLSPEHPDWSRWNESLNLVCGSLAKAIAADGEGATKLVEVHVLGGLGQSECEAVAFTVAQSPLVKTALFASDPNWGRILAAVGRAGLTELDIEKVNIDIGGLPVVRAGQRAPDYEEHRVAQHLQGSEVEIRINLGRGGQEARVWTCDLSYDYIRINAEYRS